MQYLAQMKLVPQGRPTTPEEGTAFIEQYIFPTLELCRKLQDEKKILAGGPTSGAVGLVLIVNAESARELDDLITSLPVWPRMETGWCRSPLLQAGRKAFGRGWSGKKEQLRRVG